MSFPDENNSEVIFFWTPFEFEWTSLFGLVGSDCVEISGDDNFRCDTGDFNGGDIWSGEFELGNLHSCAVQSCSHEIGDAEEMLIADESSIKSVDCSTQGEQEGSFGMLIFSSVSSLFLLAFSGRPNVT